MHFKNEETNIQVAVVNYLNFHYPEALFTIAPSGMKLPIHVARMLKAMGYRAGTPDIMIFEPRHGLHGLFIELKTKSGVVSPFQKQFMGGLMIRCYAVSFCYSYDEAIVVINRYLKKEDKNQ